MSCRRLTLCWPSEPDRSSARRNWSAAERAAGRLTRRPKFSRTWKACDVSSEWRDAALNELATLWTRADSTQSAAITDATHRIDQKLRSDPFGSSESREHDDRILFEAPLAIIFQVDLSARNVFVDHVWTTTRRSR
jgi:hypothetical protein